MSKIEAKLAAQKQTIEVSVRSFYTCNGGAMSPISSALITLHKEGPVDWADLIHNLMDRLAAMEEDLRTLSNSEKEFKGMRPMTPEEVIAQKDEAKSPTHEMNMTRQ